MATKAPIYNTGYAISSGFTCPVDGWLRWGAARGSAGNASCLLTTPQGNQIGMTLDNTNVAVNFFYPLCFCPKGTQITWQGAATSGQFYYRL